MSNQCKNCNYQNETDALFCNQCGTQLDALIHCHNCQTQNAAGTQFCYRCGQSLTPNASVKAAVDHQRSASASVSRSTSNAGGASGVSGSGWQPTPAVQPALSDLLPSEDRYKTRAPEIGTDINRARRFSWIKALLSLPALAISLFVTYAFVDKLFNRYSRLSSEEFFLFLFLGILSLIYLFWLWRRKGKRIPQGNHTMQGEVRGLKERKERKNQQATVDETVWTFRLERYEDGHRLPPIPVEMRGRMSTGFINEGDTIELVDKWRGEGLHRTKQIYNGTNGAMVETKKVGYSIWLILWMVIFFSAIGAFIVAIIWNNVK